jgi:hypothetical protein
MEMNLVLSTDHLLYRDDSTAMLEIMGELYPEAPVHTLAHQQGAILGHLELRSVKSTGLSRKAKTLDDLSGQAFLLPRLVHQIHVPCSVNVIFNVSLGLSHGIPRCEGTKQWTYWLGDDLITRPTKRLREKFFRRYLEHWSKKQLRQIDLLWVPTQELKEQFERWTSAEIAVVPPFIKLSEYPLIPASIFKNDFYMVNTQHLGPVEIEIIEKVFQQRNQRYRFFGDHTHLEAIVGNRSADLFFGERCAGELAPMLASAKGVLDFTRSLFPTQAIKGLSQGLRVIYREGSGAKFFLENPYTFATSLDEKSLNQVLDQLEWGLSFESEERKKIRAFAMDYHDLKFKGAIQRQLKKYEESL